MAISSYNTVTDNFSTLTKMTDENNGLQKKQIRKYNKGVYVKWK